MELASSPKYSYILSGLVPDYLKRTDKLLQFALILLKMAAKFEICGVLHEKNLQE
jgi:hypothetical protein